ncbi:hypothetical protein FRC07_008431 [Ceratobasidium sp. 392]|nr:hypothetical protein FRC07_008431 [Ceratobasidium sp. 392]
MLCYDTVTSHPWGAASVYFVLLGLVRLPNEIKRKTPTSAPGPLFDSVRFVSPPSASSQRARFPLEASSVPCRRLAHHHFEPSRHDLFVHQPNPSTATTARPSTEHSATLSRSPLQPSVATEQPVPQSPEDLLQSVILAYDLVVLGPEVDYMDLDEPEPAEMWTEMEQDVEMASITIDENVEMERAKTME